MTLEGAAAFSIIGDRCSGRSLGPGKSCTVTVGFAPTSAATVTLTAASTKGATAAVALTGRGRALGSVFGHQLFWADAGGSVWGANLDGSNPQAIVTSGLAGAGLAVDASHLYFTAVGAGPGRGAIWRANLHGTSPRTIVTGQDSVFGVAVGF